VILSGAGVVLGGAIAECVALAERLDAPVCNNYQHNDSFPGSHRLSVPDRSATTARGGDGAHRQGRRRAGARHAAQSVLDAARATASTTGRSPRRSSRSTSIRSHRPDQAGRRRICGDAKQGRCAAARASWRRTAGDAAAPRGASSIHREEAAWSAELDVDGRREDDPGTTWNADARKREPKAMSPRKAWRAIIAGLPRDAIISSDIGNNCAIGNAYPVFEQGRKYLAPGLFGPCGYGFPSIIGAKIGNPDAPVVGFAGDGAFGISMNEMTSIGRDPWPAITMVIFRNYQWGAEKRNSILWYDNNFVGTELDPASAMRALRKAAGSRRHGAHDGGELTEALRTACAEQAHGRHDLHRSAAEPGARRTVPARRDEEAGRRRRHPAQGHAAAKPGMSATAGPRALVLNAGSSSLKFALFERESRLWHGQIEGIGTRPRLLMDGAAPRELPASTEHAGAFDGMLAALAERGIAGRQPGRLRASHRAWWFAFRGADGRRRGAPG
jgi:sulfoacetaldehyde acetyltransferase